jgi:hypothetical protein
MMHISIDYLISYMRCEKTLFWKLQVLSWGRSLVHFIFVNWCWSEKAKTEIGIL